MWTSIWKNNNAKQLNSTTVYTEKSVYKKYWIIVKQQYKISTWRDVNKCKYIETKVDGTEEILTWQPQKTDKQTDK